DQSLQEYALQETGRGINPTRFLCFQPPYHLLPTFRMAQKKPGRSPSSTSLVFFDGFPSLVAGNVCINGNLPLARKSSFLLDKLLELFDQPWVRFASGRFPVGHVNHIARFVGCLVAGR